MWGLFPPARWNISSSTKFFLMRSQNNSKPLVRIIYSSLQDGTLSWVTHNCLPLLLTVQRSPDEVCVTMLACYRNSSHGSLQHSMFYINYEAYSPYKNESIILKYSHTWYYLNKYDWYLPFLDLLILGYRFCPVPENNLTLNSYM